MKTREINIYDAIGGWYGGYTPQMFLDAIKDPEPDEEFCVHLNTPGGSITDGLAIANRAAGLAKTNKVSMMIDGMAASMGSVIACAGTELVMAPASFFMIHNPWTMACGDADELRKNADLLDSMKKQIMAFYRARFDLTDDEISALMDDETWIAGSEAADKKLKCTVEEGIKAAAMVKGPVAFAKMPEKAKGFYVQKSAEHKPGEAGTQDNANHAPAVIPAAAPVKPDEASTDNAQGSPAVPPPATVTPAAPPSETIALSERLEAITLECRKHQSAADRLRAELKQEKEARASEVAALKVEMTAKAETVKALEARLSAASLNAFSLTPEVAGWEDAIKAVGGDPKAATHSSAVLLAFKQKFPAMYGQWLGTLKRGR